MSAGAPTPAQADAAASLARAFAEEWSHVVATLIRVTGDWSLAEDCTQEAFLAATTRWPRDGVPERPGAWLRTVARNAAVDRLRRRTTEARRLTVLAAGEVTLAAGPDELAELAELAETSSVPDDRLRLIFTCCHPALPLHGRVALTLRTLCGLEVQEIARAFGTSEAAMAKRLVRARQTIARARIPYRVPEAAELSGRLDGVLAVVYLVFTEGYSATAGRSPVRADLCLEAIRLARLLVLLLPGEAEVHALLALTLLHDARRPARADEDGTLVALEDQDRSRWDGARVAEGVRALGEAQRLAEGDGPLLLQAEIAACHSTVTGSEQPDWVLVVHLYDRLLALGTSPHAELSRAVALGMRDGPAAALPLVRELARLPMLDGTLAPVAAEADLLRRAGRVVEASDAYRRAIAVAATDGEAAFLRRRLAGLDEIRDRRGPR